MDTVKNCSFFMSILIAGFSTSHPHAPIQIQLIGIQQDMTGFCNLILEPRETKAMSVMAT